MPWNPFRPATPVPVVLYTRGNCPLCDEMKSVIDASGIRAECEFRVVDVDSDERLCALYGWTVPVLVIAGTVAFEGEASHGPLRSKFQRMAKEYHRRIRHGEEQA